MFSNLSLCLLLVFLSLLSPLLHANDGKFMNPVTDICWKCLFPIHLGGVNTTPNQKDYWDYKPSICACAGTPPKIGIPFAFWDPTALIDVTRTPYKSIALGGITLAGSTIKGRGSVSHVGDSNRHSYYNVHYYKYPITSILEVIPGFSCIEAGSDIDIAYISELDPHWFDEDWTNIISPEAYLFANPLAQAACIADCTSTSLDKPLDKLYWCAGCSGSLYPLMGHVAHHVGAIQASHLLVQRLLSKMHSMGMLTGAVQGNYCEKKPMPRIQKSLYKTQLTYPIANTKGPCNPLGKSDVIWGAGQSYPYAGEDFVYLIWSKKHCCIDSVKISTTLMGVP